MRNPLRLLLLAAALVAGLSTAAQPHGRNAVPSDPRELAQYQDGLAAYLDEKYAAALSRWRPLAEQGIAAAQIFLGLMHENGQGMARDQAGAAAWYRRAAERDDVLAQMRLGMLYRRGEGVPRDDVQAYLWFSLAARQDVHGHKVAAALQEAVKTGMTAAQIAAGDRLARDWAKRHKAAE